MKKSVDSETSNEEYENDRDVEDLDQENAKLIRKIDDLKLKNSELTEKLESFKKYKDENNSVSKASYSRILINQFKADTQQTKAQLCNMEEFHKNLIKEINKAKESNVELENSIFQSNQKYKILQKLRSKLRDQINGFKEYENELIEKIKGHDFSEMNMAESLIEIKSRIIKAHAFYQKYEVHILHKFFNTKANLVIKRNNDESYTLTINIKGSKKSYNFISIDEVYMHQFKINRFNIRFGQELTKFRTKDSNKIVNTMKEILRISTKI